MREFDSIRSVASEDKTLADLESTSAGALPGHESAEIVETVVDASRGATLKKPWLIESLCLWFSSSPLRSEHAEAFQQQGIL